MAGLNRELIDLRALFDLRWKADQRAVKRWKAAHPERQLVWPDHADMVVWLIEQADENAARIAIVRAAAQAAHDAVWHPSLPESWRLIETAGGDIGPSARTLRALHDLLEAVADQEEPDAGH